MTWLRYLVVLVVGLFGSISTAQAAYDPKTIHVDYPPTIDYIGSYDVHIIAQPDGSLDVTETIQYYFGESTPAHGIERYIPQRYAGTVFGDTLDIQLDSVLDDDGETWPVEELQDGAYTVWRIGSAATTVKKLQTYQLHYTVQWAMTDYDDYIELYWDAIDTEWAVPVTDITIRLVVPANSQLVDYPVLCYYGSYGADNSCSASYDGNQLYTVSLDRLEAYEGVTLIAAFAPETIHLPSAAAYWFHRLMGNWSLLLIPLWILAGLALWMLNRKVIPSKPLIPIYEVPTGITSPSMAEYLLNGKLTPKALAGELVESARLGELEFVYDEKKGEVTTLRSTGQAARTDAATVMLRNQLFGKAKEIELKRTTIATTGFMASAKQQADAAIKANGWIDSFKKMIKTFGGLYGLAGFVGGGFMIAGGNNSSVQHLVITGITFLVFGLVTFFLQGSHLPLNTVGADVRSLLEGFKWFLGVTETERIKFSQVPKLTPKMFEEFLPYAIVFGVEKQWVKQFEHILQDPPQWMHGANRAILYTALLSTGRTPSQFKVPMSARAGGSGYSGGGGFSGGGFGGGGGGRW